MSYTPRESKSSNDSINTYDSLAFGAGTYLASATLGCNTELIAFLVGVKGAGAFVQGNAYASPSGGSNTPSLSFTGDNKRGNCIIVDASMSGLFGPGATTAVCEDSQGNSYSQVVDDAVGGGNTIGFVFVAFNVSDGPNDVTVTFTPGFGDSPGPVTLAISEYNAGTEINGIDGVAGALGPIFNLSVNVTTSVLLHLVIFIAPACSGSPFNITGGSNIPPGWLIINEPGVGSPPTGGGYIDRTKYLFLGESHQNSFTNQLRQRGQATIHLRVIDQSDNYAPTRGSQVFLYDQVGPTDDAIFYLNFSGLITNIENQYFSNEKDRFIIITAASFESVFDTVLATLPTQFFEEQSGDIFTAVFNLFEEGCPLTLGNVQPGAIIHLLNTNFDKISDLYNQISTASQYIWGVNAATLQTYFQPPDTTPSPFSLTTPNVSELGFGPGWGTVNWKLEGNDYRNRQCIRLSPDAFPRSQEFFVGAGQESFTLLRPVNQVTNAWVTTWTPNSATGTFSSAPSVGDTITLQYVRSNDNVGWIANHFYDVGGIIIDGNNHVQKVISPISPPGESGATEPVWDDKGGTTNDNELIWQDQGISGLGTGTLYEYTFVDVLDNTQFGQVLCGLTADDAAANFNEALNAFISDGFTDGQGIKFSLPTWENGMVNSTVSGPTITIKSKVPGGAFIAVLSTTSAHFAWSAPYTSGGTAPQTSVGTGSGSTETINVGQSGTDVSGPGLVYTPGSSVVTLVTPLNVGTNLVVEYNRAGGDVIQVENSSLVRALAEISHGTGKYQAIVDYSQSLVNVNAADGLLQAQQILAAYSITPQRVTFTTYQPGLAIGQILTIDLTLPTGAVGVVNGVWVIEEINADIEACEIQGLAPGIGHYKYTFSVVDIQEIGSYLDFWEGLAGGSSATGEGSVSALVTGAGGGGMATQGNTPVFGGVSEKTVDYTASENDYGLILVFNSSSPVTLTLPAIAPGSNSSGQWGIFVANIGSGALTVTPNGLDLDGLASDITILKSAGRYVSTDSINYFSERGDPPLATNTSPGIVEPDNITIKIAAGVISTIGSTGVPSVVQVSWDETPSGTVNGINDIFTLANAPIPAASLQLFQNGILAIQGIDYTLTGNTITFSNAPSTGAFLNAFYRFGSPAGLYADDETPGGIVDGSNAAFTLAHSPSPGSSLKLYIDGVLGIQGTDYTLSGSTITFSSAPSIGALLIAYYVYSNTVTNYADNETPSGTVNGTNDIFTLANTPNPAMSLQLYVNGILQLYGTDFTLLAATITFTNAPSTGAILTAFYRYA